MAKIVYSGLCYLFFLGVLNASSESVTSKLLGKIIKVDSIEKAKLLFPNAEIYELNRNAAKALGSIRYTLGSRTAGDRILSSGSDRVSYKKTQDVQLLLEFKESPNSGLGSVVTFVEVVVNQSSNVGKGYIVRGGIGQCHIAIVIEAKSTTFFTYDGSIFGI